MLDGEPTAGIRNERVFAAACPDGDEGSVGIGGGRTIQAFLSAAEIIVYRREHVVARHVVEKDCRSLAATFQACFQIIVRLSE